MVIVVVVVSCRVDSVVVDGVNGVKESIPSLTKVNGLELIHASASTKRVSNSFLFNKHCLLTS